MPSKIVQTTSAAAKVAATTGTKPQDAVSLLRADHRKVEGLFAEYKRAITESDKTRIARQICKELIVHTKLEEEIFYRACRDKQVEHDILDEAQVEHDGAKLMITGLIDGNPEDDFYDAKVSVLAEYIKHHVGEEEKPRNGIFAKAQKAQIDMNALGQKLQTRKQELMAQTDVNRLEAPKPRSLHRNPMSQENSSMARYSNDRDRDERGRFMSDDDDHRRSSSYRTSRGRYDDDDHGGGHSPRGNYRDRDEEGRFTSEDDGRSRGGYSSRGDYRARDEEGRFTGEDNGRSRSGYSSYGGSRERDEEGRFTSDDRRRYGSAGGYSSRNGNRERDEQGRFMSDDDGRASRGGRGRYPSRSSSHDDNDRRGRGGHGGWFGDSEGHSEAAERGWEGRSSSRGGYSSRSRDDDDDRRSSRSRIGEGHGGWFGDSRGHAEAARRGWQDRD